jgi:lipopolysaccharide transport system ATP-binding protein
MSKIISVDDLGKKYLLRHQAERYTALRDVITRKAVDFGRRFRDLSRVSAIPTTEEFWALRDVSFDVAQGDRLGIIGRNGAGKSTLLKVLSRVTEPSTGRIRLRGRVASLLEVGTGFHPELTGRENIYLNGAILGMNRAEIRRKFDEIVAFAEVEKFLDTPVKRYSSGMYVRLAFAVAVHLEPEILIVDEVLAVGDAQFQRKCVSKMQSISSGGRTILFVSHNMAAIRSVCNAGIVLEKGKVQNCGTIDDAVEFYMAMMRDRLSLDSEKASTESFVVESVSVSSAASSAINTFDDVEIRVVVTPKVDIIDPGLYIGILTNENFRVFGLDLKDFQTLPPMRQGRSYAYGFRISNFPLLHGEYQLEVHLKDMSSHAVELVPRQYIFEVAEGPVYGGRKIDGWHGYFGARAEVFSQECSATSQNYLVGREIG